MAEACQADKAYFITNGTTIGILAMILTACKANEKIILPRNVHKSVINGLILSGAIPVFIKPNIDKDLGIANDITYDSVQEAIEEHPDAKAVFVINPTYFGVISDLVRITELAHKNDMIVLVDDTRGYKSTGFHGYQASFWNREVVYSNLGFDDFISKEDFDLDEILGWAISDRSFFRQALDISLIQEPFYRIMR